MKPKKITRKSSSLVFSFSETDETEIPLAWLRSQCACASCLENKSSEIPLFSSKEALNAYYQVRRMDAIGNYAFSIVWGDRHHSIFAFDRVFEAFSRLGLPEHLQALKVSGADQ